VRRSIVVAVLVVTARAHGEPVVLPAGGIDAELVVEANLAPGSFAQPLSLAPDGWVGITERWTLGVVHSDPAIDRTGDGASVCVRTDPLDCVRAYRGGGIDARWLAGELGPVVVAPRARLLVRDVSPWKPAITLGALARWARGAVELTADPYLQLGLANRSAGNRSELIAPVQIAGEIGNRGRVELRTGYHSELAVWRDGYHVPVWVGGRVRATAELEVGAAIGFYSLLGPQATVKQRAAFVTVRWVGRLWAE
jgi:hypothetical protein